MKKFISLALTAAMVASLVPATAFAKTKDGDTINGTVSVVNAWNENKDFKGDVNSKTGQNVPEVQIRVGNVDIQGTDAGKLARFTVRLDNANFFEKADVDTVAEREAAKDAFNNAKYATIRLNPNGVVGDSNHSSADTIYSYTFANDTVLRTMLGQYYDKATKSHDATKATGTVAAADVKNPAGVKMIPKASLYSTSALALAGGGADSVSGTATGYVPTTAIGTVVDGTNLVGAAGLTGRTMDIAYTAANAVGYTAEQVRLEALKAAGGTTESVDPDEAVAAGTYVWVTDLSLVNPAFDQTFDADTPGWFLASAGASKADPTKAFTAEYAIRKLKADSTKAAYWDGVDGTDGFKPIPAWDEFYADKDTWIDAALAAIKGNTTNGAYTQSSSLVGVDGERPIYGLDRTGMRVYIANESDIRSNEITFTVDNPNFPTEGFLENGDIISVDLVSTLVNASKNAGVSVTSKDFTLSNDNADFTYVNVDKEAIQLSVRKVVDVAEDEIVSLDDKGVKIATNVGYFRSGDDNKITLKINGGFEFAPSSQNNSDWGIQAKNDGANVPGGARVTDFTKEEIVVTVDSDTVNEITIYGIDIKAASAKIDKVATIKATSPGFTSSSAVEVAKVVDYIVNLTVDEDEDVPVIYSGVNSDNYGITDDSDHWSLDVTAKESFPGAWSFRKGFNFELPDHVFVTDVEVVSTENLLLSNKPNGAIDAATPVGEDEVFVAFFNAYQNGSHVNFEFDKRVFDDVDAKLTDDPAEMTFRLQLVADTGFEGDVPLKLTGELVEEQEVTIAKFVKPFEVKAEQNDIIIDYRYTDVPTAITITEAEAGLWDGDKATFRFDLEKSDKTFLAFEDATFEIDSKSGMSIKDDDVKDNQIVFTVDDESDDAAATVTMKNIQLFMNRSIPAGPYDLTLGSSLQDKYLAEMLFAPDDIDDGISNETDYRNKVKTVGGYNTNVNPAKEDSYVDDVDDVMDTVKEGFVNVVTAGRDVDDASFTTKVVVPVGENYIVAGEKQIELDTPAYINAAGYTMLPIRAVATALGINNQNVLWDQPTKTVTILYGQRIITMTQGQKVVYVNGSAIPASAAVENTNSRTFLPMRDLATALGVTDITWDQATRTATLNGNQKGNQ